MSLSRTDARKKTMTILYQISLYEKNKIDYDFDEVIKENLDSIDNFVLDLVHGVIDNKSSIDELADKYLDNWELRRLGLTDQAIIRIAIYELLYTDIDGKVAIDEAINISKEYSDEKVVKMINGVLDKIYHMNDNK
jgi:transcription antitermination protein NusB